MVGQAGLEPAMPYGPDLQSGAVPITLYWPKYNAVRWKQPQTPLLRFFNEVLVSSKAFSLPDKLACDQALLGISITRGPSPYVHNLVYIQSVRRHSLSFGERPLTSGPSSKEPNLTQDWVPTTFTHHSELFQIVFSINPYEELMSLRLGYSYPDLIL